MASGRAPVTRSAGASYCNPAERCGKMRSPGPGGPAAAVARRSAHCAGLRGGCRRDSAPAGSPPQRGAGILEPGAGLNRFSQYGALCPTTRPAITVVQPFVSSSWSLECLRRVAYRGPLCEIRLKGKAHADPRRASRRVDSAAATTVGCCGRPAPREPRRSRSKAECGEYLEPSHVWDASASRGALANRTRLQIVLEPNAAAGSILFSLRAEQQP
jgi:hypothetical protein